MPATDLSRDQILDLLRPVTEPTLGTSIVDLGMVRETAFSNDELALEIELLTPIHPLRDQIESGVRTAATEAGIARTSIVWSHRVRSSGAGRSDAEPIKGVKNVVAVASGKGGVGKSTIAVNLAVALARSGAQVGLLDTDVYGPSIPIMMGISEKPLMRNNKMVPIEAHGVKLMSIGFILEPDKALIWRGPLVAQLITQFLNDVDWGELDYLILDLPPGTGDVQLTLVQRIPISGAIIVTTPQEVALADARKGLKMFQEVKSPVLGIIENMSYFQAPDTGTIYHIFGEGGGKALAEEGEVELLGQIPLESIVREGSDLGQPVVSQYPESLTAKAFDAAAVRVAMRLAADAVKKPRKPMLMFKPVR
ncbi:MAG TPA: Mrp/NBP35 family ATP-binding protein [Thermomicrobiales bacterium]|nr:Mrp/NBP35 family ATP-binding protein [Thermomicrobiales bacterium]HRA46861.1 Mrp/NBP35 family ATP-binding protein [Thermomicrobiales bacterium]